MIPEPVGDEAVYLFLDELAADGVITLNGVVNEILRSLGLSLLAIDWLGDPKFALWTLMIVIVWKEVGFGIALFLARLMSVDSALYDSAKLDGAGWWAQLLHITIPQLRTIIEFFVIITVINMLSWANRSLIEDGRSQSDIRQGVTLEVMGEGSSMGSSRNFLKELRSLI